MLRTRCLTTRFMPMLTQRAIGISAPCCKDKNKDDDKNKDTKADQAAAFKQLKFEFTKENKRRAVALLSFYPEKEKRGALVPLLDLAQRQYGWLPISAMLTIAGMVGVEPFAVWEVANFYHMFRLKPAGKYYISVCTTTPCYLRGSTELIKVCSRVLDLKVGETSKDLKYTLKKSECLGACVNGPVMSINDDLYEDLTEMDLEVLMNELKCDKIPPSGPRSGRFASEPRGGLTSLKSPPLPPGFNMQELC